MRLQREAMAEEQVVRRGGREPEVGLAGGVRADAVALVGRLLGSFIVIHMPTSSPSAWASTSAYSAKRSAVSRLAQPPTSSSGCGRSQW